jgi:hypothetical protein
VLASLVTTDAGLNDVEKANGDGYSNNDNFKHNRRPYRRELSGQTTRIVGGRRSSKSSLSAGGLCFANCKSNKGPGVVEYLFLGVKDNREGEREREWEARGHLVVLEGEMWVSM